ncbi:TPA: hypothetical protein N0F65_006300 [Lagenidium giganteum]|uniref:RING-type domain-containing protein n=1 Tax=Lagenidium giganteum TaxID=4803 RepID=A0AAV2YN63_9STRA|nr:TPA: hypothetical protein N0F65_006300 [Lagenidium giganteum]
MRAASALQTVSDAMYEAASDCSLCDKKFHAFRRKHRCKACGHAVCGNCARTHRLLPLSPLVRYTNEPVRVCDRCVQDQNQMMLERRRAEDIERSRARQQAAIEEENRTREAEQQRKAQEEREAAAREKSRREMKLRALEEKHLGPRPDRNRVRRTRSLDDARHAVSPAAQLIEHEISEVEKRAVRLLPTTTISTQDGVLAAAPMATSEAIPMPVHEAEECAICLESMEVGQAIYTTECGHSFHWNCLKDIQKSDTSNYDKCPSCRAVMTEMQVKKNCDHPRVRVGHRFCRDCGNPASEFDVKPRPSDPVVPPPNPGPNQPASYRASSHGALVRCPQCQIQMRVLPHMYNMRVACPSGHMFLVQVAGGGRPPPPRQAYPGPSYYRSGNAYSEL